MKYFFISNATDEKEIGKTYPQCKGVPEGYTFKWYDEPNSMTNLTNKEFPKNNPDLVFELKKDAILTDIISPGNISAKGLLINQKVKDLLDSFNVIDHRYYPAKLFANKNIYDYYWLHIVKDDLQGIDFKNTSFAEFDFFMDKVREVKVSSAESYDKAIKNRLDPYNTIAPVQMVLEKSHMGKDLLYFPIIVRDIIISDELAESLLREKITGFSLEQTSFTD